METICLAKTSSKRLAEIFALGFQMSMLGLYLTLLIETGMDA